MTHLLYTLLIALANNLDNIGVRIAYSIRGIRISLQKNLWLSAITFIFASLAALSGSLLSGMFSKSISSWVSMVLLIGIGLLIILEGKKTDGGKSDEDSDRKPGKGIFGILMKPENADMDNSKEIDFKEATFLGIALSMDNIGGGLSAGMIGLNFIFVGLISAAISFLTLWVGNYVAEMFKRRKLGNKASIIAGIALIAIGIKQVL